jgi:hypothetical protein
LNKTAAKLLVGVAAVFTIAACSENLDAGHTCPLLCPQQAITLHDTVVDAVAVDTTITGLPPIGLEAALMLASHGDTLDSRAIVRFDTLPQQFIAGNGDDSTIVEVDSAILVTPITKPDSLHRPKGPITIEAYDVDTLADGVDTVASVLGSLFRRDRFLGSKTFAPESLVDTLRIPISTDTVLNYLTNGKRLRVGYRLLGAQGQGYDLLLGTSAAGNPVSLRLKTSQDTAAQATIVSLLSNTPADQLFLAQPLVDYSIIVRGALPEDPLLLSVGGAPPRRSYLQFNIPSHIVDSTTIVRAALELTQVPNRHVDLHDSSFVYPLAILASPTITDIRTALTFTGPTGQFGLDSLLLAPGDSGVRSFQIVGLVRSWRGLATSLVPRLMGLKSGLEGEKPGQFDFFSTRAPAGLRPRLRITYVPQTNFGLP